MKEPQTSQGAPALAWNVQGISGSHRHRRLPDPKGERFLCQCLVAVGRRGNSPEGRQTRLPVWERPLLCGGHREEPELRSLGSCEAARARASKPLAMSIIEEYSLLTDESEAAAFAVGGRRVSSEPRHR